MSKASANQGPVIRRVLVVEDDQDTARKLAAGVERSPRLRVCGAVHSFRAGRDSLASLRPDFLLTDIGLPDGTGIDLVHLARAADWPCDSMIVSVFGDEARVIEAIRAGAKGYVLKSADLDHIALSVESVIDGGSPMSPKIARHLLTRLAGSDTAALPGAPLPERDRIQLTKRETEVLAAIARGYKRQEVADLLDITVGTVGTHVNSIYQKLQVGSNTAAVAAATRIGLL